MLAEVDVFALCARRRAQRGDHPGPALPDRLRRRQQPALPRGIAEDLAKRNIIYAPDFIANAGGIIHAAEEHAGEHDPERVAQRVQGIHDVVAQILEESESIGRTPLSAAYRIARRRLVAGRETARVWRMSTVDALKAATLGDGTQRRSAAPAATRWGTCCRARPFATRTSSR